MSYLLRMSDEIRDWLADLCDGDPVAARQVGAALAAVMNDGPGIGPPLVVPLDGPPWSYPSSDDLPEALDDSYSDRLERLQTLRSHLAEAAGLARDMKQRVSDLEAQAARLGEQRWRALQDGKPEAAAAAVDELATAQEQLAELQRLLPGVIDAEQQLTRKQQREQAWVDSFRTRKETLKATYQAARAQSEIHEALAEWGVQAGVAAEASDSEVADALRETVAAMERELHPRVSAEGLMELRPGAPGDSGIRILFAAEPPGTALLIAVLEGPDAVQEQRGEAVALSAEVLQRARAGEAPEAAAVAFEDVPAFLDEFFPGSADDVEAAAATLSARNRARTLARERERLGLSERQVAERMSVRPERVAAIERAEPGATEVRTLAAYVEALGGRLEIIADFGDERVTLR